MRLPLNVALDIAVAHLDGELDLIVDIDDAAVWIVLGVDLSVEEFVSPDGGDHVGGTAINGHVVTGTQLVRTNNIVNDEERFLYLSECCGCVVGQPAHPFAGIPVVKRVASVWGRQTEIPTGLVGWNILEK